MERKLVLGLAAFTVVVLLVGGYAVAGKGVAGFKGKNFDGERHEAVTAALEAGDYDAWIALMSEKPGKARVAEVVTEETFAKFAEAHAAMKAGDFEAAKAIKEELGLGLGHMKGAGKPGGCGMHAGFKGAGGGRGGCALAAGAEGDGGCPMRGGLMKDPEVRECVKACFAEASAE